MEKERQENPVISAVAVPTLAPGTEAMPSSASKGILLANGNPKPYGYLSHEPG
jgi:hypothetical protein